MPDKTLELWDRPAEVRGFSLWQPWASLVALGVKTIETRSWSTRYRGPLAIHSAKRRLRETDFAENLSAIDAAFHRREMCVVDDLPLGCVVASCTLADVVPIIDPGLCEWHGDHARDVGPLAHAAIDGQVILHRPDAPMHTTVLVEEAFGDYTPGRFAWVLEDIQRIEPIPAKGHQGLWKIDPASIDGWAVLDA